jgi:hypothetical protein
VLATREADEVTVQRRLEQSLDNGQVRQVEPLLREINAHHGLVRKRRAASTGHRRGPCDQRNELAPRHHQLHLAPKHRFSRASRAQVQSQFGLFLHDRIVPLRQPSDYWELHGILNAIPSGDAECTLNWFMP